MDEPTLFDLPPAPDEEPEPLLVPEVPEERWAKLYSLAHDVRRLEPWKRLSDCDWFGIQDPDTNEISIVTVFGAAKEVYSVMLHLPQEGIMFWNDVLVTGRASLTLAQYQSRMIECEFVGKADLEEFDLAVIQRGFKPEGKRRHSWPVFRSTEPGYAPAPIDATAAESLTIALQLVPQFDQLLAERRADYYETTNDLGFPLIPIFHLKQDGDPGLPEDWIAEPGFFPLAAEPALPDPPEDELFLARLKNLELVADVTWECGSFFVPSKVMHHGRWAWPTLIITADPSSPLPPIPTLGMPDEDKFQLFSQSLTATAQALGYLPETILVTDLVAEKLFSRLKDARGMTVKLVDELATVTPLASELSNAMAYGPDFQPEIEPELDIDDETDFFKFLEMMSAMADPHTETKSRSKGKAKKGKAKKAPTGRPEDAYRSPESKTRYQLRIDLANAKPPIWRRITIPVDASFFDLHAAIQGAMGWYDSHLHAFEIRDGHRCIYRIEWDPDKAEDFIFFGCKALPEVATTLESMVEQGVKKIHYTYDFGDGWEHTIKVEKVIESDAGDPMPQLIKGKGACPPEDCGGIYAYMALLQNDPDFVSDYDPDFVKAVQNTTFDPATDVDFPNPKELLDDHAVRNSMI